MSLEYDTRSEPMDAQDSAPIKDFACSVMYASSSADFVEILPKKVETASSWLERSFCGDPSPVLSRKTAVSIA